MSEWCCSVATVAATRRRPYFFSNKYPSQSACSPGLPYSMQPRPFRMQSCPCLLVCIPGLSKKKETKPEKLFNCLVVIFLFWSFGRFGCFILVESFYSFLFFSLLFSSFLRFFSLYMIDNNTCTYYVCIINTAVQYLLFGPKNPKL